MQNGEIKVTLEKRGDILRNNIFGVDIDKEATEVAIMSLYLKMLDEGYDKGERDLFFVKGHVLPDMTDNVKCGNSLIGTDYFDGKLEIDMEEMKEIKPFDWAKEFIAVFPSAPLREQDAQRTVSGAEPGFDCVIGNPPYTYMISDNQQKYFAKSYQYQDYQKDLYLLFLERYNYLLKQGGEFGVIISNTWLQSITYRRIRQYLSTQYCWI
jgi:hypothetical protein